MAAVAEARGVPLLFVHIPAPFDTGHPMAVEILDRLQESMGLSEYDTGATGRLAKRLLRRLDALGTPNLDLTPALADGSGRYYWSECHIDVDAHKLIVEHLAPRVEELLPAR
jgi:hypothetical protein